MPRRREKKITDVGRVVKFWKFWHWAERRDGRKTSPPSLSEHDVYLGTRPKATDLTTSSNTRYPVGIVVGSRDIIKKRTPSARRLTDSALIPRSIMFFLGSPSAERPRRAGSQYSPISRIFRPRRGGGPCYYHKAGGDRFPPSRARPKSIWWNYNAIIVIVAGTDGEGATGMKSRKKVFDKNAPFACVGRIHF